jgi:hypothetical protein
MYRAVTVWLLEHELILASEEEIAPHLIHIDISFGA